MKTTDYTLAEIDDYIAVRKLVTRKEMRLAHEYEKSLEWRHMDYLHNLRDDLSYHRARMRCERKQEVAVADNSFWINASTRHQTWLNHETEYISYDNDRLPCKVNGIDIPEHLRRTLDLILTHGKNRQVSISLIMCAKGVCFKTAESKYYYDLKALSKRLRKKNKKSFPKVQGK